MHAAIFELYQTINTNNYRNNIFFPRNIHEFMKDNPEEAILNTSLPYQKVVDFMQRTESPKFRLFTQYYNISWFEKPIIQGILKLIQENKFPESEFNLLCLMDTSELNEYFTQASQEIINASTDDIREENENIEDILNIEPLPIHPSIMQHLNNLKNDIEALPEDIKKIQQLMVDIQQLITRYNQKRFADYAKRDVEANNIHSQIINIIYNTQISDRIHCKRRPLAPTSTIYLCLYRDNVQHLEVMELLEHLGTYELAYETFFLISALSSHGNSVTFRELTDYIKRIPKDFLTINLISDLTLFIDKINGVNSCPTILHCLDRRVTINVFIKYCVELISLIGIEIPSNIEQLSFDEQTQQTSFNKFYFITKICKSVTWRDIYLELFTNNQFNNQERIALIIELGEFDSASVNSILQLDEELRKLCFELLRSSSNPLMFSSEPLKLASRLNNLCLRKRAETITREDILATKSEGIIRLFDTRLKSVDEQELKTIQSTPTI